MADILSIQNKRMLHLMDEVIALKFVTSEKEFLDKIGFTRNNIYKLRRGEISFTVEQIRKACEIFNVNANWIIGLEKVVFRKDKMSPIEQIRAALIALESEQKPRKLTAAAKK